MNFYRRLVHAKEHQGGLFVVLIDPDGFKTKHLDELFGLANEACIDAFFIGGSYVFRNKVDETIRLLRQNLKLPTVLFPGSPLQISNEADALLLLSLISGRNAELLIGKHVEAVPLLLDSPLDIIPTGYMLIDGGRPSSVSYISNTTPIPHDKNEIALATALAGQMLGLKLIYADAGSGANVAVSDGMIKRLSQTLSVPLVVGGGIKTPEEVYNKILAGANATVVGNVLEKAPSLVIEMSLAAKEASSKLIVNANNV